MTEKRLLVLDDDALTGETLKNVAEFAGMCVHVTSSPHDFFTEIDNWAPTHIALDLVMPEMDGVEVLTELSKRQVSAYIMITSGVGQQVLQAAARSASAHGLNIIGVLPKPFSPQHFREVVNAAPQLSDELMSDNARGSKEITVAALQEAIENEQLYVVFQPKVECQSGLLTGFEALARWQHPELGFVSPDQFIAVAEKNNLIDLLTRLVFKKALIWFSGFCQQKAFSNIASTARPLLCSINISVLSLRNLDLFNTLDALCQQYGVAPEQIMLELTETGAMDDAVASLDLLTRLRMRGFQLSIDDFGTGFSSMLQLVRMPFSEVKIDKSFIMTVNHSRESRLVTKAIIDLAHSLDMLVIAEGIEDEPTLAFLQQLGCDKAQGYYIGRPLATSEVDSWLVERMNLVEKLRLERLHALKLLDTPSEQRFDRLTRLAKRLFNVPISLVSLVDSDRQWFKSKVGLDVNETPREYAFCHTTIQHDDAFVVLDASKDPIYRENPLVTGMPYIRFYAGQPITAPTGERLGSFCIIDDKPRFFNEQEVALLKELGTMVEEEIAANMKLAEDHLTGILNRRGFENRAQHMLDLCLKQNMTASLIYIDINNFKRINDQGGHQAGDDALKDFAMLLQQTFRDSDLMARIGGDEFIVMMVNPQGSTSHKEAIERLKNAVQGHNNTVDSSLQLHFSYGIAQTVVTTDYHLPTLYDKADQMMYANKHRPEISDL
ncbi:EAL domain-containing protein [Methylophaga frappieri]|nr:EAL domain-containing protein [Methylophaga frappieri]